MESKYKEKTQWELPPHNRDFVLKKHLGLYKNL